MYFHEGGFITLVHFQNHIPDYSEIYHLQRVIQGYARHFTHILFLTAPINTIYA